MSDSILTLAQSKNWTDLGIALHKLRLERNLSLRQLATMAGCSHERIRQIEQGDVKGDVAEATLVRIRQAILSVPPWKAPAPPPKPLYVSAEALGRYFRHLRERRALTQWRVADLLGRDKAWVARMESGTHLMQPAAMEQVCAFYHKTPAVAIQEAAKLYGPAKFGTMAICAVGDMLKWGHPEV